LKKERGVEGGKKPPRKIGGRSLQLCNTQEKEEPIRYFKVEKEKEEIMSGGEGKFPQTWNASSIRERDPESWLKEKSSSVGKKKSSSFRHFGAGRGKKKRRKKMNANISFSFNAE